MRTGGRDRPGLVFVADRDDEEPARTRIVCIAFGELLAGNGDALPRDVTRPRFVFGATTSPLRALLRRRAAARTAGRRMPPAPAARTTVRETADGRATNGSSTFRPRCRARRRFPRACSPRRRASTRTSPCGALRSSASAAFPARRRSRPYTGGEWRVHRSRNARSSRSATKRRMRSRSDIVSIGLSVPARRKGSGNAAIASRH